MSPDLGDSALIRDRLLELVNGAGARLFVGSCPEIYKEPAFRSIAPGVSLPRAGKMGRECLAFLTHPTMTTGEIHATADAVLVALRRIGCVS